MQRFTKIIWVIAAVGMLTLGGLTRNAEATPAQTQRATVRLAATRKIALKARPGNIKQEELEQESGGSGLRYSFVIKSGPKTYEVGVDAKTGKLLENAPEGKNPD